MRWLKCHNLLFSPAGTNSMKEYPQSKALHERACRVLAGGVSSEFRKFNAPHPLFYTEGHGSHVVDADGNDYLDFTLSQGPLILGHSHPYVLETVRKYSAPGQLFAGQSLLELELAEKLQSLIPCAELLRFSLSGSEADHAALRLARAVTGRQKFVRFEGHYHGWFDNVAVGIAAPSLEAMGERENPNPIAWTQGLPERVNDEIILLPWNDLALLEKVVSERHEEIAAIISEGIMCNSGCIPPQPSYLEGIRALCDRYGIVMILDEVITGFRVGMGGAQEYFGITPDLAIFGKAMASGYPISVLAGKQKFMQLIADGKVIHAGTMNAGNPSIAAARATIEVLEQERVHEKLFRLGQRLADGLREAARNAGQAVLIQGPGPMFHMGFTDETAVRDYRETFAYNKARYAAFTLALQERGIRIIGRGLWYISAAHTEAEIDHCITVAGEVLRDLQS
jgi:glutamate-1-semialdehyde 2,1-aminomutase